MIDFKYNAQINEMVQYFNIDGSLAVQYPYSELEKWADKRFDEMDANEVDSYIDDNWVQVSTDFYIARTPSEFKSNNTYSQTQRIV